MELIRGKRLTLRLHPFAPVMLALLLATAGVQSTVAGAAALLAHELFHLAALLLLRIPIGTLELTPFGAVISADAFGEASYCEQLTVALVGPVGSFAVSGVALMLFPSANVFARASFAIGLLNLLPILPLDGGRTVLSLAAWLGCERAARRTLTWFAYGASLCLMALSVAEACRGRFSPTAAMCGLYLGYAAHQSSLTERVRLAEQSLRSQYKLRSRGAMPLCWHACRSDLTKAEMMRFWRSLPTNRIHRIVLFDGDKPISELDESEVAERLLR